MDRTIFVGNLPPEAEEQDVRNRLGQLPVQVDGVEFGKDLQEARSSRGQHAKVVLTTEDGARTARQRCNNEQIRCRKAKEVRSSPPVHRSPFTVAIGRGVALLVPAVDCAVSGLVFPLCCVSGACWFLP